MPEVALLVNLPTASTKVVVMTVGSFDLLMVFFFTRSEFILVHCVLRCASVYIVFSVFMITI